MTASTMYNRGLLNNLAKMDGFVMKSGSMCRYLSMAIKMVIVIDNIENIEVNMLAARTKEQRLYSLIPFVRYTADIRGNAMAPMRQSITLKQMMRKFDVLIAACLVAINEAISNTLQVTMKGEITSNMMPMLVVGEVDICVVLSSGDAIAFDADIQIALLLFPFLS